MLMKNGFLKDKVIIQIKSLIENIDSILERRTIIGESISTKQLRKDIEKYSQSGFEYFNYQAHSGTGKELVA